MTLNVFEIRGAFLFRAGDDVEIPPSLSAHYNADEDRYEVPEREELSALSVEWRLVADPDAYRVAFERTPPTAVTDAGLLVTETPFRTVVLCPDEAAVETAVSAGGHRVDRGENGDSD